MARHMKAGRTPVRGMSIQVVLVLVTVLSLIASCMVALCLMNLNFAQLYYNANTAMNEAEAGVARLLYNLADDKTFGQDEAAEIRGRLAEGLTDEQSFHVVTFRKNSEFPYSVNNADGNRPIGDEGRAIPSKMIHAFSTGYCNGQYRTVEVLIERPPFPFALAVESRIRSANALIVEGAESTADYLAGKKNRPGHICSNYRSQGSTRDEKAIFVDEDRTNETFISGMARACGAVQILNGKILGGVMPGASKIDLPDIPVDRFRQEPEEGKGVVEITADRLHAPESGTFELDVVYYRRGNLVFDGSVHLNNGLLYVEGGSLTIRGGGLSGVGAIVVDGEKVTIQGDTSLEGTNKVALITSGAIDLLGQGNYFQGIVYAKGAVTAKNITVVGNLITTSTHRNAGVSLDKTRLVSNKELGRIDFTATTYSSARWLHSTGSNGPAPFRAIPDGNGGFRFTVDPATYLTDGSICYSDPTDIFGPTTGTPDWNEISGMNIDFEGISGGVDTREGGLREHVPEMVAALTTMKAQVTVIKELTARITALEAQIASMPDTVEEVVDPGPPPVKEEVPNPDKEAKQSELAAAIQSRAEAYTTFNEARDAFYTNYNLYVTRNAGYQGYSDGKNTADLGTRIVRPVSIDLNQFRASGADLQVKYWHVFNRKL